MPILTFTVSVNNIASCPRVVGQTELWCQQWPIRIQRELARFLGTCWVIKDGYCLSPTWVSVIGAISLLGITQSSHDPTRFLANRSSQSCAKSFSILIDAHWILYCLGISPRYIFAAAFNALFQRLIIVLKQRRRKLAIEALSLTMRSLGWRRSLNSIVNLLL